jgi:hypothetical protein
MVLFTNHLPVSTIGECEVKKVTIFTSQKIIKIRFKLEMMQKYQITHYSGIRSINLSEMKILVNLKLLNTGKNFSHKF